METYRDVYLRFIENYRTPTGGINIYPQFDYDLELLLDWLCNDEVMNDVLVDGTYLPNVDCTWQQKGNKMKFNFSSVVHNSWMLIVIIGLLINLSAKTISIDTFYMCIVGIGIWNALVDLYNKE